jgi:hypothetical protein
VTEHVRTRLNASLFVLLLAAVPLVLFGGDTPLRALVVFAALLFVPGGALLTLLPVGRIPEWIGLAISLSLAIEVAGSLILIWSHWWRPEILALVLAILSAAALLTSIRRTGGIITAPAPESLGRNG